MTETTATGFGNRVTYTGMDTLDERTRNAVESTDGRRIDWSQVYGNYRRPPGTPLMRRPTKCLCFRRRARNPWIAT